MASRQNTVDYISGQMAAAGTVSARKMFGEYGVYCDGVFIGVICNDTLYLKPTSEGAAQAPELEHAPAYEGAKPSLLIPEDKLDDTEWLAALVALTRDHLPAKKDA